MSEVSRSVLVLLLVTAFSSACSVRKHDSDVGETPQDSVQADGAEDSVHPDSLIPDVQPDGLSDLRSDDLPEVADADSKAPDNDDTSLDVPEPELDTQEDVGPECETADQCPAPEEVCQAAACVSGKCVVGNLPDQADPGVDNAAGDCQYPVCDGNGGFTLVAQPADVPLDPNPCVTVGCEGGTPTKEDQPLDTVCGEGLYCDGAGHCVGCMLDSECPGAGFDPTCAWPACVMGVCDIAHAPAGTLLPGDLPHDCLNTVCNGFGGIEAVGDDSETPPEDGTICTVDWCEGGFAQVSSAPAGTLCTDSGGQVCTGTGACVECLSGADCASKVCNLATSKCADPTCDDDVWNGDEAGADCGGDTCIKRCENSVTCKVDSDCLSGHCLAGFCRECAQASHCGPNNECLTWACNDGFCSKNVLPVDTFTATQVPGDCKVRVCADDQGNYGELISDTDVPVDSTACTDDVCNNGVPSNPNAMTGTACNDLGGKVCNGNGTCVQCVSDADCTAQMCVVALGECFPYSCSDTTENGIETDVDCGGNCPPCGSGKACAINLDCKSSMCSLNVCM